MVNLNKKSLKKNNTLFKILFLIVFLCVIKINAQDLAFPSNQLNDSTSIAKAIEKLSEKLIALEQTKEEKDFSYLLKYQIGAKKYIASLNSIDSFRINNKKNYPEYFELMYVQYETYCRTLLKNKADFSVGLFKEILTTRIDEIMDEEVHLWIPSFFNSDPELLKEKFHVLIKPQEKKETISRKDAEKLVKSYVTYLVNNKVTKPATDVLDQIKHEKFIIENDILITTKDGAELSITLVRPRVEKKLSTILNFNIYAGSFDESYALEAANKGYVGIVANTRGKKNSANSIEPFIHDGKDAYEIIDWISKQTWSDGKVGMYGGSYLGFSQWAATKTLHPALKTIVPQVAVGVGIDYPMHNNVFMSYMLRWIHYVENNKTTDTEGFNNEKRWDSLFHKWYKSGKAFNTLDSLDSHPKKTFQKWLSHPSYDDFWQDMVPYKSDFEHIKIPILTTTGYYDDDQRGAFYYLNEHYKHLNNPEHYLLIGPYDHGGAQAFPKKIVQGYEIDSVARINIYDLIFKWFDYQLKAGPKPELLKGKFNFQIMGSNQWKHTQSLDNFNKKKLTFYLSSNKTKSNYNLLNKEKAKTDFIDYKLDLKDRNDGDNYQDPFSVLKISDSIIKLPHGIAFETKVFENDIDIAGSFVAKLNFISNKKDFDYNIRLYVIEPDGSYFFLNENIGRASFNKDNEHRQLLIPYEKQSITINNTFFTAKRIKTGSKLLINIGINKNPYWQINYGTGKDVSTETINDADTPLEIKWYNNSEIIIPIYED